MTSQVKIKKPTQKQTAIAFGVRRRGIIKDPELQTSLRRYSSFLRRGILSTQQEVIDCVFQETGKKVSQSTVSRFLKWRGITHKKITYHYDEQLKHTDKVEKFIEKIPFLSRSPVLAIDECSFHLNEVPRYAYATKGQRANRRKPRGMKSKDFHNFLTNLEIDKKYYLLMDNLKVHHATRSCQKLGLSTIKELMSSKNIEPEYLPPY
ncbi:10489_t:CDS:2 [Gigaspora margarita]|uniref:10489_t:CDS:1 n=1 Tax=Gigaspora margarita TaxID=4874 RepID=A0ABM8VWP7_GIGMA|nr:10489_t:CDS:2 [Gigaspora margarita]